VLELSGNDTARQSFARTHCHLHLFRLYYGGGIATKALREHKTIVAAVRKGEPDEAIAAMRSHIEASRARLRPVFDQE
jgi:DNA-binding GntR family transcriptional regulator